MKSIYIILTKSDTILSKNRAFGYCNHLIWTHTKVAILR